MLYICLDSYISKQNRLKSCYKISMEPNLELVDFHIAVAPARSADGASLRQSRSYTLHWSILKPAVI